MIMMRGTGPRVGESPPGYPQNYIASEAWVDDKYLDEAAADTRYGQLAGTNDWTGVNIFSEVIASNATWNTALQPGGLRLEESLPQPTTSWSNRIWQTPAVDIYVGRRRRHFRALSFRGW
jgi:hypothetical protein